MSSGRIDLMSEIVTLFGDEDLIAFFQFERTMPSRQVVAGLCKVGRPKKKGVLQYFSLDFIVDTPVEVVRKGFDASLDPLDKPAALELLPGADSVMLEQGNQVGKEAYVRHVDLIMKKRPADERAFIENDLCPVLAQVCNLKCEAPVWWDDIKDLKAAGESTSLFGRLKQLFK